MEVIMEGITKSFGANQVLKGVDIKLSPGEIHAIMGENGAGKSTMMNILTGLHKRDGGKIFIDDEEKYFSNVKEAEEFGITFIHQEMNTLPNMSVLENMFLNKELKNPFGVLNTKEMTYQANQVFERLNIKMDASQPMSDLSVGEQQMIEIAKCLMTDAKVLIMDEPTAALSEREIDILFGIIRKLKAEQVSIVYISHRMEEIFALCDRITVMRDGVTVSSYTTKEADMALLVKDMVGREIGDFYPEKTNEIGATKFEVRGLTKKGVFQDISFSVKEGEIIGFSGLMGAGRTEIMRGIFGIDALDSGDIYLEGERLTIKSASDAISHGIGFLTEDRKDEGLILDFTLKDNILLPSISEFSKKVILEDKLINEFVDLLMKRLTVKAESRESLASSLSGGNQQKVVLAKWIGIGPKVLILDEPTRGVDVGAKREIYLLINELAARGVSIIVVSSDLPEVMSISDRVLVINEGRLTGEVSRAEATQEKIMNFATGGI